MRNSPDLASWYGESFDAGFQRLSQLSSEQLLKVIDFRGLFQFPAVVYLQLSLNHTIHHRGQLSMYRRPMGAKAPSIYGQSHYDAEARQASQAFKSAT